MKKALIIAAVASIGMMGVATEASAFNAKKCKACHAIDKNKVGPAWKDIAEAYGSAEELAKVFKDGFKVEDRKMIAANGKWKGKAGLMTGQFKHLIKGHEDEAAKALFDAVAAGKI